MARRLPAKIAAAAFAALLAALPACADESAAPPAGSVSANQLRARQQNAKKLWVFDARSKNEFDHEHIAGARLPYGDEYYRGWDLYHQHAVREAPDGRVSLERSTQELPRDAAIVTYCNRHCGLSQSLKVQLEHLGFTNVHWLDGGIDVWREKGYPVEKA